MLHGSYEPWLVAASLLMAVLASYTALNLTERVTASRGWVARWWLSCGAVAMGLGIWSMHFLGMLAFQLPIQVGYSPWITFISALIAIAASAFALWTVCQDTLTRARLLIGSFIMGAGVCSMHFTGMAAMEMNLSIAYIPSLLALSIVIAVVASGIALWIGFYLRVHEKQSMWVRAVAAGVMGIAISGMHYTAMAAAEFRLGSVSEVEHIGETRQWLAGLIIVVVMAVILIALITSILDYRLEARTAKLSSSLEVAKSELEFLALHDSLTKLPNRLLLEDRLEQEKRHAIRAHSLLAVLFLDLDGFKQVNDAYGHEMGDRLLLEVSRRIREEIRSTDTLARLEGDEFVLLAKAGDSGDAANLAQKLNMVVQKPVEIARQEVCISASIGVALFDGKSKVRSDLVKNADAAMSRAKELGRNGFCFFEDSMNEDLQRKLQRLHDLRIALERRQFVLHYQPKFDIRTQDILGVEALLRWLHPTDGLVPPNEFIPLAEKSGMMLSIGEWVLDEACRQIGEWRASLHPDWHVAVNLSTMQFKHPGMVRMVREVLERYSLKPDCLMLEITESMAMHDVESSMAILRQLSEMGVRISIDDFGTGYSSLLYLKRLPASELKIDSGFVYDLGHNAEDEPIIASIVALGNTLNLKVVAEGVETLEQFELLKKLGCDSVQGYFLCEPHPAAELLVQEAVTSPHGMSMTVPSQLAKERGFVLKP